MKYSFTVEVKTKDRSVHMYFDSNDARDLRSGWQAIKYTLRDLKFALIIEEYSMEADNNTAKTWKDGGYI